MVTVNSHQAKAKNPFDDCRLISDLFRLFFVSSVSLSPSLSFGVIRPLHELYRETLVRIDSDCFTLCCRTTSRGRTSGTS